MVQQHSVYTGPTKADLACIPEALKTLPQWVLWRGEDRVDEQTGEIRLNKIPINPQTLRNADTADPLTWGTFDHCVAALPVALEGWEQEDPAAYRGGGLGFVFTADDPYTGIDLDHCRDPETGTTQPWAQTIIADFESYTEITPSGTGLHILVQGILPPRGRKKGHIEMYSERRFFTMTGWQLPQSPPTITACQAALVALHEQVFGKGEPAQARTSPAHVTLEDTALLTKAHQAGNSDKFRRLYDAGDWSDYSSQSEADLGLCIRLAFWTQDPEQIDRLFRQSGLLRAKWDERRGEKTYGARTIAEALARQTEHYTLRQEATKRRNGHHSRPEPPDPTAHTELPAALRVDDEEADVASPWLNDYIAFSRKWAPRAYDGFHEACGLFNLATTAARRIKIDFGARGVYTSLYMAMASRTSMYTKSTTADLGIDILERAGLKYLLAGDDATPQAFIRSLTLHVPEAYGDLLASDQDDIKHGLAFAGQKGWFYEEWGQHLQAMMQKEGAMASFRSILRRMDDHKPEYTYDSITRGRDRLLNPYVTLLANVTPADLKPFVRAKSPLWRDGFIARFAFIAPGTTAPTETPFPDESIVYPNDLIKSLQAWHKRLGIPIVAIDPVQDAKGKPTGRFRASFAIPRRETIYTLAPEVRTAFYAYDTALRAIVAQLHNEDLDGSYVRFPIRALRIAGLLASLHDDDGRHMIRPIHWARGQQIAERWRRDLHTLMRQIQDDDTPTRESETEQRVLRVLRTKSPLPVRDIHLASKLSYAEITAALKTLKAAGVAEELTTARTTKWGYVTLEGLNE